MEELAKPVEYKEYETADGRKEVPLMWTKYGNRPVEGIEHTTAMEVMQGEDGEVDAVKFHEFFHDKATGELLRNNFHLLRLRGLDIGIKADARLA